MTFLKWAGGKTRLIEQYDRFFPKQIDLYAEPFLGGGAVFFHLKSRFPKMQAFLSDINWGLINAYRAVRDEPDLLLDILTEMKKNHSEEFYYRTRALSDFTPKDGLLDLQSAADFIYLNRTCFNGLFRVNRDGKFNVPIGNYKNPKICDEKAILLASELLEGTVITACDFASSLNTIGGKILASSGDKKRNSSVYLDPPYLKVDPNSFVGYTTEGFTIESHEKLLNLAQRTAGLGSKVLLSNSLDPDGLYEMSGFKVVQIESSNRINSNGDGRKKTTEILAISP